MDVVALCVPQNCGAQTSADCFHSALLELEMIEQVFEVHG